MLRHSRRLLRALSAPRAPLGGAVRARAVGSGRRSFSTPPKDEGELLAADKPPKIATHNRFRANDIWTPTLWTRKVAPTLRAFKELEDHLLVPQAFVVPWGDARWPEVAWEYPLGMAVKWLRNQRHPGNMLPAPVLEDLAEMGFIWHVAQFKFDSIFMPTLRRFHEIYGHTDVPNKFVIASNDDRWPEMARGVHLGRTVAAIRCVGMFASQVADSSEELERLEFCWNSTIFDRNWRVKIMPSLETFRRERGHCLVERSFVVPSESPWPKKAWGMALGSIVCVIRAGQYYTVQVARDKERLIDLGFAWSHSDAVWQERILPAFVTFATKFGHCHVRKPFEVPREAPWPEKAWGLKLGINLRNFSTRGGFFTQVGRDAERLEKVGFPLILAPVAWENTAAPLLRIYSSLFPKQQVPKDFVIPSTSPWPEKRWGVRLGIIVSHNPQCLRGEPTEA
ncbi:hypothetical protein BBJ28_00007168 [Nothophytophthora sp. Chile5]|nr:hypothetical protein BBJ28_00007168 [Nothophytophthora sp. Chile5]